MTDAKTPRALILIAILALVGAMLVAGCGGSGGTTATNQGPPPGANTPEATEEAEVEEEPTEESESAEATEEEAPAEEETEEAGGEEEAPGEEEAGGEEEGGASAATIAEGKTVFTTNCGSCHTLAEAGTSGTIGPNLDELEPSESTVEQQVINGGGPMPAFGKEDLLDPEEVKAVATYVSSVAGTE